jgi:hypothetical protein
MTTNAPTSMANETTMLNKPVATLGVRDPLSARSNNIAEGKQLATPIIVPTAAASVAPMALLHGIARTFSILSLYHRKIYTTLENPRSATRS